MNIVAIVGAAATVSVAVVTIFSWITSNRRTQSNVFLELQKEYGSPEMGIAIRSVWEFYEHHQKDDFIEAYANQYPLNQYKHDAIHYQRRNVSQFYSKIAALRYVHKILRKKDVGSIWSKDDLSIIPNVLIPIATKGMPRALGKPEVEFDKLHISFKNMKKLYDEAEDLDP